MDILLLPNMNLLDGIAYLTKSIISKISCLIKNILPSFKIIGKLFKVAFILLE